MKLHLFSFFLCMCFSAQSYATESIESFTINLTQHWVGYASLAIFALAYLLVMLEDKIHLKKSKPVLLVAGIIWALIAWHYHSEGQGHLIAPAINTYFLEYAQLFFFLLVAMTYINSMMERDVFNSLRHWLTNKQFTYRNLFWLTGILAFVISPVADNLTTALILCAVIMTVAPDKPQFIVPCSINIVVAANAGGAFSPFGDITTLMVWQKGVVPFTEFQALFFPSVINFLIPALIMQFAIPVGNPKNQTTERITIQRGGFAIVILFLLTILSAVSFHHLLEIPPVFGMLLGLGYLKLYGFWLRIHSPEWTHKTENPPGTSDDPLDFDVFAQIAHAEWDTLFFFYGVIMSVGALTFIGYMELVSVFMYQDLGMTQANILVGILSAFIDNIPVMFSVLAMEPDMPQAQWLLVTLSAGVGGSMLSIGSAAGVALMGQTRGVYTFVAHLKWTPVIALGFVCSIALHMWLQNLQV